MRGRATSTALSARGTGHDGPGPRPSRSMTPSRLKNGMKRELRKWVPVYDLTHWEFGVGDTISQKDTGTVMGINFHSGTKTVTVHGAHDCNYDGSDPLDLCVRHELLHLMIADIGLATALDSLQNKETSKTISDMIEVLCDRVAVATGRAYDAGKSARTS